jgi:ankyrin repeat protein
LNYDSVNEALSSHCHQDPVPEGGGASVKTNPSGGGGKKDIEPIELNFYNGDFIARTTEQEDCLNSLLIGLKDHAFTALISGSPGAGKSSLAAALIDILAEDGKKIVYVADSVKLREEIEKNFEKSVASNEENKSAVAFNNYEALLRKDSVLIDEGMTLVGDDDLKTYFATSADKDLKNKVNFEQFRQECGVMTGTLEEYYALASHQSLFSGKNKLKAKLFQLFTNYRLKLSQESKIHLSLYAFHAGEDHHDTIIIVDEAMDLSRFQLKTLIDLYPKLILMGDFNQALYDSANTMDYLGHLVTSKNPNKIICLTGTHRCGQNVAKVASNLLGVIRHLGLRHSIFVDREVMSHRVYLGYVGFHSGLKVGTESWYQSIDTAVICHPDRIADVRTKLNTPLVFSIDQIKGLSYKRVVIYNWLASSNNEGKKKLEKLIQLVSGKKLTRETSTSEDLMQITFLHCLYAAATRAEDQLIFMFLGKVTPILTEFISLLEKGIVSPEGGAEETSIRASTIEDWNRERQKLVDSKNMEQAAAIEEKLSKVPESIVQANPTGNGAPPEEHRSHDAKVSDLSIIFSISSLNKQQEYKSGGGGKYPDVSTFTINFSEPLTAQSINDLLSLEETQLNLIETQHILALLQASADFDATYYQKLLLKLKLQLHKAVIDKTSIPQLTKGSVMDILVSNKLTRDIFCINHQELLGNLINASPHLKTVIVSLIQGDIDDNTLTCLSFIDEMSIYDQLLKKSKKNLPLLAMLDLATQPGCIFENKKHTIDEFKKNITKKTLEQLKKDIIKRQSVLNEAILCNPVDNYPEVLRYYAGLGVNIGQPYRSGGNWTSLSEELIKRRNLKALCAFLELSKLDINDRNYKDTTLLVIAAKQGCEDIVCTLLNFKADTNKAASNGRTPLFEAVYAKHATTVGLLLNAKADVHQPYEGETSRFEAECRRNLDIIKCLLSSEVNPNQPDASGPTPFSEVISLWRLTAVQCLLNPEKNPNQPDASGSTPLFEAVNAGHLVAVQCLLSAKADANLGDRLNGTTPLFAAAQAGSLPMIQQLLSAKVNVNKPDKTGGTMLFSAATRGHSVAFQCLLSAKADANLRDRSSGTTPLFAAAKAGNLPIVEQLLSAKVNINQPAASVSTPLFEAIKAGHLVAVQCLLSANADVNLEDIFSGATPLFVAAHAGSLPIVEQLLSAKVNINQPDATGFTMLFSAVKRRDLVAVQCLLRAKADANLADKQDERTPLFAAVQMKDVPIVKELLSAKADANLPNKSSGTTPLFEAARGGYLFAVQCLLSAKADVNLANKNGGHPPLFAAVQAKDVPVVKKLLSAKADVNLKNKYGGATIFFEAVKSKDRDIIRLLHSAGADASLKGRMQP